MSIAQARSRETERDIAAEMAALGAESRAAARVLAASSAEARRHALEAAAAAIRNDEAATLEANAKDMAAAEASGLSGALLDRLALDPGRVEAMAAGVEQVAALDDPLGRLLGEWERPERASHPPGVGAHRRHRDHLRIATERDRRRRRALLDVGERGGGGGGGGGGRSCAAAPRAGTPRAPLRRPCARPSPRPGCRRGASSSVPTTDRAAVGILLGMDNALDLIVPRGGRSLIERVLAESRVPVMAHLDGNCHVYVHAGADP